MCKLPLVKLKYCLRDGEKNSSRAYAGLNLASMSSTIHELINFYKFGEYLNSSIFRGLFYLYFGKAYSKVHNS